MKKKVEIERRINEYTYHRNITTVVNTRELSHLQSNIRYNPNIFTF